MSKITQIKSFVNYAMKAKNEHGVHSPFVFELVTQVLYCPHEYYAYRKVEAYRKKLKENHEVINVTDFGAGSNVIDGNKRKVSDIARSAVKGKKYGMLMFRLVNYFKPQEILEFGTCLGVTTMSMAMVNSKSRVTTMEGCPSLANLSKKACDKLKIGNVEFKIGEFSEHLDEVLASREQLDFVFFDGNHQYEPTIEYFEKCLTKAGDESVFVFDDIYWSDEMKKAWEVIRSHPRVTVSIDLYQMGIVFFNPDLKKQAFTIRF